ncbi:alpha/beta fold hydrolase [Streptomyces montanisoli]|uniref:Alpha/beta hydrolase n=1 Tax=Streptomyces montanisoli TaxID=2798581 RepID=A0A940MFM4_9ACTN|nr:alpha/beta hydrolase [Streptomyces montanisoli]MBP0459988.1 alpha/beta hydrolase [Streptomyces montanisoli]
MPEQYAQHAVRRTEVTGADGLRLAAWEYGRGSGREGGAGSAGDAGGAGAPGAAEPGVLLLHGLMGRASHWAGTARWLAERHRVVAFDQRGHGESERPADGLLTREAYVADAEAVIEALDLAPVTLIGHAMGALTAWQLAARRPDLVRALVVFDMRASALGAASQREWEDWFSSWPLPFPSLGAARRWFAEEDAWLQGVQVPARGDFHADMLRRADDGWRPVFSRHQMLRTREAWVLDAHWEELAQVRCPTLVVRGIDGELGRAEAMEMVRVLPHGAYAEIPDAGHLVHYADPAAWRAATEPFLDGVLTG